MKLQCHFSWQAQYFVKLHCNFSVAVACSAGAISGGVAADVGVA